MQNTKVETQFFPIRAKIKAETTALGNVITRTGSAGPKGKFSLCGPSRTSLAPSCIWKVAYFPESASTSDRQQAASRIALPISAAVGSGCVCCPRLCVAVSARSYSRKPCGWRERISCPRCGPRRRVDGGEIL
jgi:hypothetical protein